MFTGVLDFALKLLFPKAPTWVGSFLGAAIPAVIELVEAVQETDKNGQEKFEFVVSEVRETLDEAFDDLPEWSEYTEEGRDRIIGGLTELAVFLGDIVDDQGKKKARRRWRKVLKKIDGASLK
tara:strand:- start:913 stop:1281 length:369 start_codon:yes stop_codon:yes gene_type:complete